MEERFVKESKRDANYFIGIEINRTKRFEEQKYPGIRSVLISVEGRGTCVEH